MDKQFRTSLNVLKRAETNDVISSRSRPIIYYPQLDKLYLKNNLEHVQPIKWMKNLFFLIQIKT